MHLSTRNKPSSSPAGAFIPPHALKLALTACVVMLACVTLLGGCSKPRTDERPPEPGDVAVARIQSGTIWSSDVRNEAVAQGLIGEGEPLDITSDLFRRMLEEVIDQKLLAREATNKGLDRSLTATRRIEAARERILGDLLVENTVDQAIDEKAVKSLYDEQLKLSKQSEEIHARMILSRSKNEADAIFKQLQGGSVFEALAMEKSSDQATRLNGGDMGYFTTDIMPQAYKAALTTAKPGTIVGPIQVENGWAILRVEDRRPEQPPTMEEARPQILRFLTYDQVRILLNKLRKGTKVDLLIKESSLSGGADREPASAPKAAFDESASEASSVSPLESASASSAAAKSTAKP
jgi:peptidyl-prolyl cis-trans isomerase C